MAERMAEKVARITKNPKFIRNICTSAHIHHGKTAFTDNLLAAAGHMASKYAGDLEEGIRGAMLTGGPIMLEPMQIMLLEAPIEYTGSLTKLASSIRGQLLDLQQEETMVFIKAKLPVMNMLGWSSDLRSATEGRGVSSLVDQSFERLPAELQTKVVSQIKERKGLTDAMVGI